ncbi:hypothetical protein M3J09_009937 [Ascochyta lentis]
MDTTVLWKTGYYPSISTNNTLAETIHAPTRGERNRGSATPGHKAAKCQQPGSQGAQHQRIVLSILSENQRPRQNTLVDVRPNHDAPFQNKARSPPALSLRTPPPQSNGEPLLGNPGWSRIVVCVPHYATGRQYRIMSSKEEALGGG